ncbi:minor capsid protein [Clostridium sp. KNHs216]|nr:minor capsid protein [Clostridium sp. KNHs216]
MADNPLLTTPRGSIVQTKAGTVKIEWNPQIMRFNGQYSAAQKWLDNEVIKDCDPFVPFRTGELDLSAKLGTDIGSGEVDYIAPYARKMYYGLSFDFDRSSHPQAQAQWFEAAKAVHKQTWINGAKKLAGGG